MNNNDEIFYYTYPLESMVNMFPGIIYGCVETAIAVGYRYDGILHRNAVFYSDERKEMYMWAWVDLRFKL